jgi:hypothetical protein
MCGFAGGRRNHLGVERCVAVGEVRVELDPGFIAIMGVDAARVAAETAGPEKLAVRRGRKTAAKHRCERLALLLVDQRRGRKKRGLARGCKGLALRPVFNDTACFNYPFFQAPARRSCDGLDTLPLGEAKRVFLSGSMRGAPGRKRRPSWPCVVALNYGGSI